MYAVKAKGYYKKARGELLLRKLLVSYACRCSPATGWLSIVNRDLYLPRTTASFFFSYVSSSFSVFFTVFSLRELFREI